MNLEMSNELEKFLLARGKIVLNACPGGGKTTAIARKLMDLEPEYLSTHGNYSGVACLSFTNAAKEELNDKYLELRGGQLKFPHLVSTIDSFINQYITLPYYYLLNRDFERPKILDDVNILNSAWKIDYIDKKTGKTKEGLKKEINDFKAKSGRSIYYVYAPSSIRLEPDASFTIKGKMPSDEKVDIKVFNNYCKHIKKWQFEKGLITTNDSAYIAYHLITKNPKISQWLALRFPHILVDEAQDNSLLQHRIFEELGNQGLKNIEFVGDPYQSLYEFRDANPGLFLEKYSDGNYQPLDLTNNRRSPQHIIDCFSLLRAKDHVKIETACKQNLDIPITVYRYSDDNRSDIINHFEGICNDKAFLKRKIVVRGNTIRNQMLGRNAIQKPWHSQTAYDLIQAKIEYADKNIKEAISISRRIAVKLQFSSLSYAKLIEKRKDLQLDYNFNAFLIKFIQNLPALSNTVKEWTDLTERYLRDTLGLTEAVLLGLKRPSRYLAKTTLTESVDAHFNRVDIDKTGSLTTIHKVKGKTLEAILIFFDKHNHRENINFRDIACEEDGEFISEIKRIIYVAMSRPEHLLAMAFPESISEEDIKTKFGDNIKIVPVNDL